MREPRLLGRFAAACCVQQAAGIMLQEGLWLLLLLSPLLLCPLLLVWGWLVQLLWVWGVLVSGVLVCGVLVQLRLV